MKKFLISILLGSLSLVLSTPIASAWWIDSYDTNIDVQESGTLLITETINANFSDDPHHGIFRLIPRKIYDTDGNLEKLRLKLLSVTDENGESIPYTKINFSESTQIKIGDADILIQYPQTYVLAYEVSNDLGYLENYDELYWNAIGTEWETDIYQATATVILPEGIESPHDIIPECFTGAYGTSESDCSTSVVSATEVNFATNNALNWYEGFTISVKFPTGLVAEPSELFWLLMDLWPIIIIPIVFMFLFNRWKTNGKDKKIHTIVPEYQPPKEISAIEASILIDEKADMKDISAIIIDLAIKGFIKIEEVEKKTLGFFKNKDYILHRLKKDKEDNLQKFEQTLLKNIFDNEDKNELSDLKNKFYKKIPELKKQMFEAVMSKKLFVKNPEKAKTPYIIIGVIIIMIGFTSVGGLTFYTAGIILGLSLVFCGILTIVFGLYMPKKTDQGHELYKKILGLKMYIETAEKDRIKFHEKRQHFEKLLPYAMIFGQTKHWAKQFEDIYIEPPDWYDAHTWGAASVFSLGDFTHNLENATAAIGTSLSSAPGSSNSGGGGFSGGGGGGGGGGAW